MNNFRHEYNIWCEDNYFCDETRQELKQIQGNETEIEDCFYKNLEFGTGGLRGIMGAGTNRMNKYTVSRATFGLADFILEKNTAKKGVAIAFDSRRMSKEFALESALCLAEKGIKVYLFDSLRPTPVLSFAVRKLGCIAGIVITASHNPPQYNGYKVYWEDGGQITSPKDKQITEKIDKIIDYRIVRTMDKKEAEEQGLLFSIGKAMDDQYIEALKRELLNPDIIQTFGRDLRIVYTPLHGTGNVPVRRILKEIGFDYVYVVPEQEHPDGNFSTVAYPNPEDAQAFKLALDYAKELDADLVLATDPDADRLGVYVKDSKMGKYRAFSGNMTGILICEYLLSQRQKKNLLTDNGCILTTIVSTNMADEIAKEYRIKLVKTLTGFKYIGEKIHEFEKKSLDHFEFGFEESYGCLVGDYTRDKDAVSAIMILCEAAAYYKSKNLDLWQQMILLYEKYGYYMEGMETRKLEGIEGAKQIDKQMEILRESPLTVIEGIKVLSVTDYSNHIKTDILSGETESVLLPKSNVLYYELEKEGWFCIRPSGTEPKIKYYFGVKGKSFKDAKMQLSKLKEGISKLH